MSSSAVQHAFKHNIKRREYNIKRYVCRTCLAEHKSMTSVFALANGFDVAYDDIISSVTGVQISKDDGLTSYICAICKQNAKAAYQYQLQARKADAALRDTAPRVSAERRHASPAADCSGLQHESDNTLQEHNIEEKRKIEKKFKSEAKVRMKTFKEEHGRIENEVKFSTVKVEFAEYQDDHDYDDGPASPVENCPGVFVKKEQVKLEEPISTQGCNVCGAIFESLTSLQSHSLVCLKAERAEEKSNYCPVCGDLFDNALALLQHARTHNQLMVGNAAKKSHSTKKSSHAKTLSITRYKNKHPIEHVQSVPEHPRCGICSNVFDTPDALRQHFIKHSDATVTWCALCDKLFLEPFYLKRHLQNGHSDEDVASSDKMAATARATDLGKLIKDRNCSDSLYLVVCPQCGELMLSAKDLLIHNTTEHPDFSHCCPLCFKLFRDAKTVVTHRGLCVPSDRYDCTICKQKFVREKILAKHILSKHTATIDNKKKLEYACNICGKQFSKLDALDKHKFRTHRKKSAGEKIYECDICHFKVRDKSNLATHLRIHDPTYKPGPPRFLCRFCGVCLGQSSNLVVHIRRYHTGEKPFKCKFCNKAFVRTSDRAEHERTHTGVKPYPCKVCGMRFSKSWVLTQHMRVHTGERPYKCSHCGQAFTQKYDMKKHERRHTGESAHACNICGESFTQAKNLREHKAGCIGVPTSPVAMMDPHLAMIKGQMQFARSYSQNS